MLLDMVVICLLPKPEGGFRPIGLLPWLARVWMKIRRNVVTEWERNNVRDYLYAGKAKGADVAVWRQAARAEMANVHTVPYAQALLDMVKCFDRVAHDIILREAIALEYPLWMVRLSLAAYRMRRTVRVGIAYSACVLACRGITAGAGHATTELRVVLIRIIDRALFAFPAVVPTLFVDDLSAEATGPEPHVKHSLGGFIDQVATELIDDRHELSATKCTCCASSASLAAGLVLRWQKWGIRAASAIKSLGVGLSAGKRRIRDSAPAQPLLPFVTTQQMKHFCFFN